jgi:hypothetical protein
MGEWGVLFQIVWKRWSKLVSGSAGTFLGFLIAHFSVALRRSEYIFLASSIALGVYAVALAWRDEHRQLRLELEKNAKPRFQVEVSRALENATDLSAFVLKVTILNLTNAPSSIRSVVISGHKGGEAWSVAAKTFGDGAIKWREPKPMPAGVSERGYVEELREGLIQDALPFLTKQIMSRGQFVEGWLLFDDIPVVLPAGEPLPFVVYVTDTFGDIHGPTAITCDLEAGLVNLSNKSALV